MNINKRCIVGMTEDDLATARLRRDHAESKDGALPGGMTVEALPTVYDGRTYRSALEASWAATLDSLDIVWEYEPETFTLPSGTRYLPDFHLTEIGIWLEVNGPGVPRVEKAYELGDTLRCSCPRIRGILQCSCRWPGGELVLIGNPPRAIDPWTDERFDHWPARAKRRVAWSRGGYLSWTSTRSRNCWLTRCPRCQRIAWFDLARCRGCSAPLSGGHGYESGTEEYEFIKITGPTPEAAADQVEEEKP